MKSWKILIVEDNKDLNDLYEIVFSKHWYKVTIAEDWNKALEIVAEIEPDVVLLDIMMPVMDWFEFLEKFYEQVANIQTKKEIIIVINSNLSQDEDIKKSFELWANYYLKKSDYTPFTLVSKINEIMKKENKDFTNLF